ncbi:MAG: MucB/RseB C-terminal domain-containing protein [Gammaproteobacteria bacterium]|nr:MucB/RseB C-terminal domain-containing protein [Gammaproteobacteria bacterium]MDH4252903.1 MucB/RseB C-terminal domain-containing protein [Gammaproteobacteria bacterium]MDH5308411.1 MucB/RseB C-terminal domain-containing protein [Gammaproteobacteria bacterium]
MLRATLILVGMVGLFPGPGASARAETPASPNDWLDRMSAVVNTMNFEGTVIRRREGQSQALKVVHKVVDGVVNEKVITQEGNGLEIIRNGNEVHCILPDRKSVLVEFWNDDSTLFSTLPKSQLRFGSEYDLSIVREERVAGRNALVLAVRPHDGYRYGHRIWLDQETAFPLRTELVGGDGALLEQLKFADIRLDSDIAPQALQPSMNLDDFTWYTEPARPEIEEVESEWVCDDLPAGFRLLSETRETLPGSETPVTHIMYGDGLATVSVFIAAPTDESVAGRAAVGASNSYSVELDQAAVTAIGEVPLATVRRIAGGMRLR